MARAVPDGPSAPGARGRVVVLTGASAGVGRATAHAFAREGARIALLARGKDRLEHVAHEVQALGGLGLAIPTDVSDPAQVEAAADRAEKELGPIDVWVNDAMVTVFGFFEDVRPEEFRRVTEVTYLGCVYGTMSALRRMLPRDRGTIVQVGSALAYRAIPLQSAYCGAKFAIRGFTDSLRTELLHRKSRVRLTTVHLPAVNTPQFSWCRVRMNRHPKPVPPIYQPEVPAAAIVRASWYPKREYRVTRSTTWLVWANKVAPSFLDAYLARHGVDAQQTPQPIGPGRPDNLFAPAAGDPGTHGIFDAEARPLRRAREPTTGARRRSRTATGVR